MVMSTAKRCMWALLAWAPALAGCPADDAAPTSPSAGSADVGLPSDLAQRPGPTDVAEDRWEPPPDTGVTPDPGTGSETDPPTPDGAAAPDGGGDATLPPAPADCDPIDPAACALPWPSNLYLAPDPATPTGYRLRFGAATLPPASDGTPIDPAPYERMDGYGLGTPLIVSLPHVDTSGLATEWDLGPSLEPGAPIVWMREDGTRIPYWVEPDATQPDPERRLLFVQPAVLLEEGTRYVVAFRGLARDDGTAFEPSPGFVELRDGAPGPRRARFEAVFDTLGALGGALGDLLLAWDFVTASTFGLHRRMLAMRTDGFQATGPDGPELTVTEVVPLEGDPDIAVEVRGTFRVPSFMREVERPDGGSAWVLELDASGLPVQTGWSEPAFWVRIPHSALSGPPHGLVQYGHGQNGSGTQVRGGFNGRIANQYGLIFFACDMLGMSEDDVIGIALLLFDLNRFPWMADRLHQGMLNHLLLARAMRQRLGGLPEVQALGVTVNPAELFYSGISQGGIYGATYMALSQDVARGHLGVPGNDYSFMIQRSKNFELFEVGAALNYPDRNDRVILANAVQLLWDGTDPVSYYRHIEAAPFPDTPPHRVLLTPAKGDPQVPVVTNERVARSDIGIPILAHWDAERTPSLLTEATFPREGSGIVLYAFGNPWPPPGVNLPPEDGMDDPHGKPRQLPHHQAQKVHFFRTGEIIDVCGGDGCTPE